MTSAPRNPHQSSPLVFVSGRSGVFSGVCSAVSTTGIMQDELRRAHHMYGNHLTYPGTDVFHWWSANYRQLVAESLHGQIDRCGHGLPVDVVAHSLGCDAVREIMESCPGQVFRRIVLLGPAMDRKIAWDRLQFESMLVLYNPRDAAILAGGLIPWHPFGMAGRRGFITDDERITQVLTPGDAKTDWRGHSHYFRGRYLYDVAGRIEEFLTDS